MARRGLHNTSRHGVSFKRLDSQEALQPRVCSNMDSLQHMTERKGKRFLLNNHTSPRRLGSEVLAGSQSRKRTTPTRNQRVPTCEDLGSMDFLGIQKPCPRHGSTAPVPPRKFLQPKARRTHRQKIYSFVVATAALAH